MFFRCFLLILLGFCLSVALVGFWWLWLAFVYFCWLFVACVHFEVHKVLCLPRNLHFEVHKVLCLPRNLHTKRCAYHKIGTSQSALRGSQSAAPATKSAHEGSQSAPATKSANEPHVQKSRFTAPVTNQSALKITTMSKVLHLPKNLHFDVKPPRSLALVTKSRLWTTKARGFFCACHET